MGKKGDRKVVTRLIKQLARKMISETELEEVSFQRIAEWTQITDSLFFCFTCAVGRFYTTERETFTKGKTWPRSSCGTCKIKC